jgi:hypothetical protein
MSDKPTIQITGGFLFINGVRIARVLQYDGEPSLQFCDKDRRRSSERGTRFVEATVNEINQAIEQKGQLTDS